MIRLAIILVAAHFATEANTLIENVFPSVVGKEVSPWLQPGFTWPYPENPMYLTWWIKYNTDQLLWVVVFFVLCKAAQEHSRRVFNAASVFLLYHLMDWFMMWWNWKTDNWWSWGMVGAAGFAVILLVWPVREGKAKVVEWSDHSTGLMDY